MANAPEPVSSGGDKWTGQRQGLTPHIGRVLLPVGTSTFYKRLAGELGAAQQKEITMDTQTPEGYAALRQQELTGSGVASSNQTPWPAQQAAQRQQEQIAAAAAAKQSAANKSRQNWKQPTSNGGKRGR